MGIFAPDTRAALSNANVNLYCGLAMLVFGLFLLVMHGGPRESRMIAEFASSTDRGRDARFSRAGPRQPDREHTDYNLGFVLPVALDLATYIATAPSADSKLRMCSEFRQEMCEWNAADLGALTPQRH